MSNYILYTTHCPKCRILEKKMNDKKVQFTIIEDTNIMQKEGISSVPVLQTPDGTKLNYLAAVKLINSI